MISVRIDDELRFDELRQTYLVKTAQGDGQKSRKITFKDNIKSKLSRTKHQETPKGDMRFNW